MSSADANVPEALQPCRAPRFGFNWKTGKSNGAAIAIYFAVTTIVAVVAVAALLMARSS
jgi:hypothetical protein